MPTKVMFKVPEPPTPQATNFAKVDDVDAVPFLSENGKRAYADYLTKMTPRAFAVSASGAWCWAEEGEAPEARALATCSAKSTSRAVCTRWTSRWCGIRTWPRRRR
jgi:hypothetical protein